MGTAVLHPQDCLVVPQSNRHRRYSCVSECPSSVARPGARAISATCETSIPAASCGRDVVSGKTILDEGRGLLGRKNSSAGLLPLPDQVSQSMHRSFRMVTPKISPCRPADPYVSKHVTSSNFSSYATDTRISRCPSVPILGHAALTRTFFSECFPLHAVQLHDRRPPQCDANYLLNSARGNCTAGSSESPCAAGAALSCEKLKFLANSHFSDVFNPTRPKWVDCTDRSVHYRKRMHPELEYLGRQCAKTPLKVLPDGQGESICTNTSSVGRKYVVNKQLKRSASEKRQERLEVPIVQMPGTKEAAKNCTANLFEGVVGSQIAKCKLTSSAPPASSLEGKVVKALQTQASLDAVIQGRMCVFKTGAARSQQMGGTEGNLGASLDGQCYGSVNIAMVQKDAGCVSQDQYDLRKVDVTSTFDNQLAVGNVRKLDTEGISRSPNSVLDNDEMWVSMMNDERWAGPSFFNSPSPSSLPVPSFTFKFSRTASTDSLPKNTADTGAHMVSDNSLLDAKCTWDAAFATKDLRRMLNLDRASCNL